jgi:O-antigen/teichoic acid export membrane protein
MTNFGAPVINKKGNNAFRNLLTSTNSFATFIRGAGGTLGVQIVSAGLLFSSQMLFARLLGVESYGVYAIAFAWMQILLLAGRQGFDLATVRFVSEYKNRSEWSLLRGYLAFSRRTVFISSLVIAICMALCAWIFRSQLDAEGLWTFWFAAAALPIFAFAQIHDSAIRGLGFVVRPQLFMAILHPTLLIILLSTAILLWDMEPTANIGMAIYLGATVTILLGLRIMLRPLLPGATYTASPVADRRNWFNASLAMMFLMSFAPLLNQMSIIILGSLSGNNAAGEYSAAVRISYIIQPLIVAQNAALGPMVAGLYYSDSRARLQRITGLGVRLVGGAAFTIAIGIIIFGRSILGLLGDDFISAYPILIVLVCGNLLFALTGPASMLLNMTGHHDLSVKALAISAGFNLVAALALIPIYGAFGAAIATASTLVLWGGLMAHATWRHLEILSVFTIPWRR